MGLDAAKLFKKCFRESDNPKAVIRAFMYAHNGSATGFLEIYLRSGVLCDRLVLETIKELGFKREFQEEVDSMREFVFWAIYAAEQIKMSWDDLFERLLNAFSFEELSLAIDTNLEWQGTENKPSSAWNPEGCLHLQKRLASCKGYESSSNGRSREAEKFVTDKAIEMIGKMNFKEFLSKIP